MSKFTDNIRKIARSAEIDAKIKPPVFQDFAPIGSFRGEGLGKPGPDVCPIFYNTRENSYTPNDILRGFAGPKPNNPCDHIDTLAREPYPLHRTILDVASLNPLDSSTAQNPENLGAEVGLVIQLDGQFKKLPPDPSPLIHVTLQLARISPGLYVPAPGQENILAKYKNGVSFIYASYTNSNMFMLRENNLGGFMIYDMLTFDVASNGLNGDASDLPDYGIYVYNADRTLNIIAPASDLSRYIL